MKTRSLRWTTLAAALVLAGCAALPQPAAEALPVTPAMFKEAEGTRWTEAAPAEAQPRGQWWRAFGDPVLDDLVARADERNAGIAVAAARLRQARALVRSAASERAPQLDAGAGVVREAEPGARGRAATLTRLGADLSYEVDLFGRLARAQGAAALDAEAQAALLQSTRLLVQAQVAQAYLALRATEAEQAIVQDTVRTYRDTLDLTERRQRAGDVAELEVARARAELAATEAEDHALSRRRVLLEHALAVLVGEPASQFALPPGPLPAALPGVPPGVPATVLARRPDVSAAIARLHAAQARVGVARSAWFPRIALTASGGVASPEVSDLFRWSARAWGVGALLALPIFDGGRRAAAVEAALGEFDAAVAGYREQVLVALREVEDELATLRLLAEQARAQSRAVAAAARATALSASRYRNGLVSQLELLDAQRSELRNRRLAVQLRGAQYASTVGLIRALGGGWDHGG
ncbi:efflux transporter outer membrane subunit [Caldimonas thermodepolymerans]|uniref:Multidrug efflux system outer membrane protein n=1 Tax=Caldimonas thermodepolymerans TaxID=215580 RepID=A0AA46HW53_9BURK|nr:efflux transporter outer membrane subunit [Caldimonas thermodepolymerans]TCP07594.1 multidrug efflux system outer membrane protein [Caldimonas thermodepolymerans]UZG47765.1 efflux transporter outer membrane subunit [Caldimonas thermodepolymerans]